MAKTSTIIPRDPVPGLSSTFPKVPVSVIEEWADLTDDPVVLRLACAAYDPDKPEISDVIVERGIEE